MTTNALPPPSAALGLWNSRPVRKLRRDRWAVVCLGIIAAYLLLALAVTFGVFGDYHDTEMGHSYLGPSSDNWMLWLGTDRQERPILVRALYSAKTAIGIGLVSALAGAIIGATLGAIAGYYGKWIDDIIVWLYSTVQSIPYLLLLIMLTYIAGKGIGGLYIAFCASSWIGTCRMVRGEVIKLREAEYIQSAKAMGYGDARIIFLHLLPNTMHIVLVYFALQFIAAIKAEVIISFLGLGVQGEPSWGVMIKQSQAELINGFYWQIGAATFFMFLLVLSFNIFADALQDALDPKSL